MSRETLEAQVRKFVKQGIEGKVDFKRTLNLETAADKGSRRSVFESMLQSESSEVARR
jgi:hypothetical protein